MKSISLTSTVLHSFINFLILYFNWKETFLLLEKYFNFSILREREREIVVEGRWIEIDKKKKKKKKKKGETEEANL